MNRNIKKKYNIENGSVKNEIFSGKQMFLMINIKK